MSNLTYPIVAQRKSVLALALFAAGALGGLGCSAGVKSPSTSSGGTSGGVSGPGAGGTQGSAGTSGLGGSAPPLGGFGGSGNVDGGGCNHTSYMFEPKIPTVYLVVD